MATSFSSFIFLIIPVLLSIINDTNGHKWKHGGYGGDTSYLSGKYNEKIFIQCYNDFFNIRYIYF